MSIYTPEQARKLSILPEAFVYCWRNKTNGMQYIGYHKGHPDDGYIASSKYFKPEYKADPDNFERMIIAFGTTLDMLELETGILHWLDVRNNFQYYNLSNGHTNCILLGHSQKSIMKMRKSHANRSPETLAKMKASKQNMSELTRQRIREAALKVDRSLPQFHQKHKQETKDKIRAKALGRKHTEEAKARMSIAQKNKNWIMSTEHRQAISDANLRRKESGIKIRYHWITNDLINTRINLNDTVPIGFRIGRNISLLKKRS